MGNSELYKIMKEKDAIYAKPDFNEEDGMKAAKLEERDTTITVFSKFIKNSCNQLMLFKSKSFVGSSNNNTSGFPNRLCASSTFTVLSGEIEPSKGEVSVEKGERISVLKQDHFAYEEERVIDTVPKRIVTPFATNISLPPLFNTVLLYMLLLNDLGIDTEKHYKYMKELEAREKVKVLLAQSLFGNPDACYKVL